MKQVGLLVVLLAACSSTPPTTSLPTTAPSAPPASEPAASASNEPAPVASSAPPVDGPTLVVTLEDVPGERAGMRDVVALIKATGLRRKVGSYRLPGLCVFVPAPPLDDPEQPRRDRADTADREEPSRSVWLACGVLTDEPFELRASRAGLRIGEQPVIELPPGAKVELPHEVPPLTGIPPCPDHPAPVSFPVTLSVGKDPSRDEYPFPSLLLRAHGLLTAMPFDWAPTLTCAGIRSRRGEWFVQSCRESLYNEELQITPRGDHVDLHLYMLGERGVSRWYGGIRTPCGAKVRVSLHDQKRRDMNPDPAARPAPAERCRLRCEETKTRCLKSCREEHSILDAEGDLITPPAGHDCAATCHRAGDDCERPC